MTNKAKQFRKNLIAAIGASGNSLAFTAFVEEQGVSRKTADAVAEKLLIRLFLKAMEDGILTDEEKIQFEEMAAILEYSNEEKKELFQKLARKAFNQKLKYARADGIIVDEEREQLQNLRKELGLREVDPRTFNPKPEQFPPGSKEHKRALAAQKQEKELELREVALKTVDPKPEQFPSGSDEHKSALAAQEQESEKPSPEDVSPYLKFVPIAIVGLFLAYWAWQIWQYIQTTNSDQLREDVYVWSGIAALIAIAVVVRYILSKGVIATLIFLVIIVLPLVVYTIYVPSVITIGALIGCIAPLMPGRGSGGGGDGGGGGCGGGCGGGGG